MLTRVPHRSRRRGRDLAFTGLLLVAGVALLVWVARRLGLDPADVRGAFARVGPWFLVILALSFVRFVARTVAWQALSPGGLPLGAAIAATISGDALGNVTPFGPAASEPAKAYYLRRWRATSDTLPALMAENFFYSVSIAIYVVVGTAAMLVAFDIPAAVRLWAIVSLGAMALVLAGAVWVAWRRPTLAGGLVARLPIAGLRNLAERVRAFEERTYRSVARHGSLPARVIVCQVVFHLCSFLECWLSFWLLTGVSALLPALVFDAFNRVVNVAFKVVPLRAGVEESGTAILAAAIGFSAEGGFLLALVRKARLIVWAGVGLVLWVSHAGRRDDSHRGPAPQG